MVLCLESFRKIQKILSVFRDIPENKFKNSMQIYIARAWKGAMAGVPFNPSIFQNAFRINQNAFIFIPSLFFGHFIKWLFHHARNCCNCNKPLTNGKGDKSTPNGAGLKFVNAQRVLQL